MCSNLVQHALPIVPLVLWPHVVEAVLVVRLGVQFVGRGRALPHIGRVEHRGGAVAVRLCNGLVHPALGRRVGYGRVGSGLPPGVLSE